jgi:hypothetical protein
MAGSNRAPPCLQIPRGGSAARRGSLRWLHGGHPGPGGCGRFRRYDCGRSGGLDGGEERVGVSEGASEGAAVCFLEGLAEDLAVGERVGFAEGFADGMRWLFGRLH